MSKIVITGATGEYGKSVVESLIKKGVNTNSIYALVRDEAKAAYLKSLGVTLVVGDYNNYDSMIKAFSGTDKLLFVSSGEMQNRSEQHLQVVKAAKEANVKHILYTSQLHKTTGLTSPINFVLNSHLVTENAIKESSMSYTILRNGLYLDMLPMFLGKNVLEYGIFLPAGDGKIAFALRSDMAETAANIITAEDHKNKTYNISTAGVSFSEIAEMITQYSGKKVGYTNIDLPTYITKTVSIGVPEMFAKMIGGFAEAAKLGELDEQNSEMEKLLGRTPKSVAIFLQDIYIRAM